MQIQVIRIIIITANVITACKLITILGYGYLYERERSKIFIRILEKRKIKTI